MNEVNLGISAFSSHFFSPISGIQNTRPLLKSRLTGYDLLFLSFPAQTFIITFSLFVFLHLQSRRTDRLNVTEINVCLAFLPLKSSGHWLC